MSQIIHTKTPYDINSHMNSFERFSSHFLFVTTVARTQGGGPM